MASSDNLYRGIQSIIDLIGHKKLKTKYLVNT